MNVCLGAAGDLPFRAVRGRSSEVGTLRRHAAGWSKSVSIVPASSWIVTRGVLDREVSEGHLRYWPEGSVLVFRPPGADAGDLS